VAKEQQRTEEEEHMSTMLAAIAVALIPPVAIAMLLRLAERTQRKRDERTARQVELTDAIHRELGAIVAPTVEKRRGGGLMVRMTVPFDRPELVATLLTVTDHVFARHDDTHAVEIAFTPRPGSVAILGRSRSTQTRAMEQPVPMIAVAR
jgi:hypothetical protein